MPRFLLAPLVLGFSAIWSSAFVAGTVALRDFDPFSLLAIRFALSALILLPLCLRRPDIITDRPVMTVGLILGLLNYALYLGLSFAALRTISPAVVIVVISCAPFVTALAAAVTGGERASWSMLAGTILGFAGVVTLSGLGTAQAPDLGGLALAIAGMVAFSAGTVFFRARARGMPTLPLNFWQSVAGAVALTPVAITWGYPLALPSPGPLIALLYLVLVPTLGGMALWMVLIRRNGATAAASYHLLNPIFGVGLSALVLGTPVDFSDLIGAALIILGLLVAQIRRSAVSGKDMERRRGGLFHGPDTLGPVDSGREPPYIR